MAGTGHRHAIQGNIGIAKPDSQFNGEANGPTSSATYLWKLRPPESSHARTGDRVSKWGEIPGSGSVVEHPPVTFVDADESVDADGFAPLRNLLRVEGRTRTQDGDRSLSGSRRLSDFLGQECRSSRRFFNLFWHTDPCAVNRFGGLRCRL